MSIRLTLPDGTAARHPSGATGREAARAIGERLAAAAVAVSLDGELLDLDRPLPGDGEFAVITGGSEEGRSILRHSAAHIMAQAALNLFQGAHFAIGPAIEDGFYYDFDIGRPFTPEDLEAIEAEMKRIVAADQPFLREEMSRERGLRLFADQPYKQEIIREAQPADRAEVAAGGAVSVYRNHQFADLCRGPHIPSTGRLPAFKLLRTAGAYWRGDERRPQLQRIYGTAWESRAALGAYLTRLEEAEKRDHRRLGRELDLFSFPRELGPGLAVWHPKGGMLRKQVEDYSRRIHEQFGFEFVSSPHVARAGLWEVSGHLDFYRENMYPGMELQDARGEDEYRVKPMNCPFHVLIYRSAARSYRELPLRMSELGVVYRYERSGVIHGLMRARGFMQDDSHTFCSRSQVGEELQLHLRFVLDLLRDFGFDDFQAELSTRPEEKWVGEPALWELAERSLEEALRSAGVPYRVAAGEGAFYGPKIDVQIRDAIGRNWQMSTIQADFSLPERFGLEYVTPDDGRERPVMIHSAKFGSVERFVGVLLEHYAGALPAWLSPVQATVIPVADRHLDYAGEVVARLRERGVRAETGSGTGKLGEKVREALTAKIPAVLVVGDQDATERTVGLRRRGEAGETRGTALDEAVAALAADSQPPR